MIVHEVTVGFPTKMGGLTVRAETAVYLETATDAKRFVKVAELRGWEVLRKRTYISGTVEQAEAEVEREIELYERGGQKA